MTDEEYEIHLNGIMLGVFAAIGERLSLTVVTVERVDKMFNTYWREGLGRYTMTISVDSDTLTAFIVISDNTLHAVHAQVVTSDTTGGFAERLVSLINNIDYQPIRFYIAEKELA